jgi:DNA-directed RNA polymerase specialized sigma24 family protein
MQRGPSPAILISLRRVAARYCRYRHEAEDVVQDILLSALEAGRDCGDPRFMPWACGAIRLRARFVARSCGRRRRRETAHAQQPHEMEFPRLPDTFVAALPPSQRIVALLINLGLGRREIGYLLGLTDVALRQRLAGLRRAGERVKPQADMVREQGDPLSRQGLARRALKAAIPRLPGRNFGIRDPDGLALFFSAGHVSAASGNIGRNPHHGEPNESQI